MGARPGGARIDPLSDCAALKAAKARKKAGNIIKRAYASLRSLGFSDKEVLLMAKKEAVKHQADCKHSNL